MAEALVKKFMIYNPNTIALIKRLVTYSQGPIHDGLVKDQMYAGFSTGWRERVCR